MKILICGEWKWYRHEPAFSTALKQLGHDIIPFKTSNYFSGALGRVQFALPFPGPAIVNINSLIKKIVDKEKPDVFLAWRGTHLTPSTIKAINRKDIITVSYNNDDPFGPKFDGTAYVPWHHQFLWFWYVRSLKYYRMNFFYRKVNASEALKVGATHAEILLPYFIPWKDVPISLTEQDRHFFESDIVFAGHYEPDGRENYLIELAKSGLNVRLYGDQYWTKDVLGDFYKYFSPIRWVRGEEYSKSICGAKICLVFLSKMNRDTYTRRCFEIPAYGKVMLAERTKDLSNMFIEDKEACFFSSSKELVDKAKWLIGNPKISSEIAEAGLKRVWADGHDIKNRAKGFIDSINNKRN